MKSFSLRWLLFRFFFLQLTSSIALEHFLLPFFFLFVIILARHVCMVLWVMCFMEVQYKTSIFCLVFCTYISCLLLFLELICICCGFTEQFDDLGDHGTKIIVYNLWFNDDEHMELDFESDPKVCYFFKIFLTFSFIASFTFSENIC